MFGVGDVTEKLKTQTSGAYGAAKHAAWVATCTAATCVFAVGALFAYFCYAIGVAEASSGASDGGGSINVGYAMALLSSIVTVLSLTHIFFEYRKIAQLLDLVEVRRDWREGVQTRASRHHRHRSFV